MKNSINLGPYGAAIARVIETALGTVTTGPGSHVVGTIGQARSLRVRKFSAPKPQSPHRLCIQNNSKQKKEETTIIPSHCKNPRNSQRLRTPENQTATKLNSNARQMNPPSRFVSGPTGRSGSDPVLRPYNSIEISGLWFCILYNSTEGERKGKTGRKNMICV